MRAMLVFLTGLLWLSVWAQEAPDVRPMLQDVFPVAKVKPGMKGYGLTVFKGTKIERFEVEVIGVLERAIFDKPLVMIRARGGPITERNAMIIGGMSGSPIFLEGKILGAIGFAFLFSREPIGLVTPLEAMLTVFDSRVEAWHPAEPRTVMKPIQIGGRRYAGVYIGLERPPSPNLAWARPLMTPVMVRGVSPRLMKPLKERLEKFGLTPIMAPAGTTQRPIPVRFEPGAALGGALATGDIDLTAIGTLTYRRGNYVLGFGHPFLGAGEVEMPMTAAEIVDVIPTYDISSKMGNRAQVLGTIYRDEAFAIAGRIGRTPKMLPIRVQVSHLGKGITRTFRCEVIRHPLFASGLAATAVDEFIGRIHYGIGEASATVRWRLQTDRFGTIQYQNRVASNFLLSSEVVGDLMYAMDLILNAPDVKATIESLEVEVTIAPTYASAFIESLTTDRASYRPGERVNALVRVRPYGAQDTVSFPVSFRLPADAPPGRYLLRVSAPSQGMGGGALGLGAILVQALGGEGAGGGRQSTEELLREFQRRERNNQLIATLTMQQPTVSVNGMLLSQPPPALRALLAVPRSSKMQPQADEIKQVVDTDWVLTGMQTVFVNVLPSEDRDAARRAFSFGTAEVLTADEGESDIQETFHEREEIGSSFADERTDGEPMTSEDESAKPEADKPVSRKVKFWTPDYALLRRGEFDGVALSPDGVLSLAPTLKPLRTLPVEYLWCAVSDANGVLYVGEGVSGGLWRIEGEQSQHIPLPATLVTALAVDPDGTLYAGASPEGTLFRVQNGQVAPIGSTGARYINALQWHEGKLYIATGAPARIMVWESGVLRTLFTSEEAHFSALAVGADGTVYAGTSERGLIYRIAPSGVAEPVADLSEPSVSALFWHESGALFVGTMPSGNLYRIGADGVVQALVDQPRWSTRLWLAQGDTLLALASEGVLRVNPNLPKPQAEILSRQRHEWVGAGMLGEQRALASASGQILTLATPEEGVYLSPVLDAETIARWGAIRWNAQGAEVQIQTRSGNTREPDDTWSGWSMVYGDPNGSTLFSPPARFLQVQIRLKGDAAVRNLSLSYMPANRPPEARLLNLKPYAVLSEKQTLRWSAKDPDGDALRFEVQISSDGGQSWKPLKEAQAESKPSDSSSAPTLPTDTELQQQLLTELEANPDIPEEIKAQIRERAPEMIQQMRQAMDTQPTAPAQEPPTPARENRMEWDTTQVADGVYLLRLMATDQPAMPSDYATVYTPPIPVVVCNTPPSVLISEHSVQVDAEGRALLMGYAFQRATLKNGSERAALLTSVGITAVQYRIGEGDWFSAEPLDGLFDSSYEPFRIRTEPLPKGEHTLKIKVFNAAGKAVEIERKVKRD